MDLCERSFSLTETSNQFTFPRRHTDTFFLCGCSKTKHESSLCKGKIGQRATCAGCFPVFPSVDAGTHSSHTTTLSWNIFYRMIFFWNISAVYITAARGESYITWKFSLSLQMMAEEPPGKNGSTRPKLDQDLAGACWMSPGLYESQHRHQSSTWDGEPKKQVMPRYGSGSLLASR